MAWTGEKVELTEAQKKAALFAGVPADRPGLGDEYPKAVYKADKGNQEGKDRMLNNEPLLIGGKHAVMTATVANEDEELEAMEQGWFLSPNLQEEERKRDEMAELRAKNAELEAKLAAEKPAAAKDKATA